MYCILRDAWFIPTIKMRVSLQPRAIKNLDCLCFGTVACAKMYETCQRPPQPLAANKNHCYDSFRRLTSTKWRNSCSASGQIRVSPQFWTSDEHEMTRRLSPAVARRTRPAPKKKQKGAAFSQLPSSAVILLWSGHGQPLNIILLWSGVGGQLLNVIFLWPSTTTFFERTLCYAFLSCHLQPSSCCGKAMVSYWTSPCCGQGLVVSYWTSSSCGHLWQRSLKEPFATLFSAAMFSHHLAVVRGWWPQLLNIIFLWPSMTAFCERTLSGKNKPVKSSANVFCMYLA